MTTTIAIVGAGSMGSGIARRLADNGADILTSLAGRSEATRQRAKDAGMKSVGDAELARAGYILSILPPAEALPFSARMAPHLLNAPAKLVFVDCNAVSPATMDRIAGLIAPTGCGLVDAGIMGGPPSPGGKGPAIFASGPEAGSLQALIPLGLDIRVMNGPVGRASALKLSYAGITKGLTALAAAMILGAHRSGVSADLARELAATQPALLAWFQRQVPAMCPKAYRWVAEMEQIGEFLDSAPQGRGIYEGMAALYETMAADAASENADTTILTQFLNESLR